MRIVDADELMEHVWRDKLDSRELIAKMIENAPTVKEIPTKIPLNVLEQFKYCPNCGHPILGLVCVDIKELSPIIPQPKIGYCKDCKWQKDSDGVFRRGINAESQCPINRREVYEGTGYCHMFKPKDSDLLEKLEQEPKTEVLDRIRAEIIQVANQEKFHDEKWALGLKYATNIIDKYKEESEG